ncbi:hypothetical protein [Nibrella saemangeumensis]|uniref:hypothetical protein n=1 Tax=Nibrella saemangeumensis TaxID=1084526 RepID=UPI0031EB685E
MEEIAKCNAELERLSENTAEAESEVPAPYPYDGMKITRKNEVLLQRDEQLNILSEHLQAYNIGVRSSASTGYYPSSRQKYIAFVDILGYSQIVEKNSFEDLSRFVGFLIRDVQMYLTSEEAGKSKTRLYLHGFAPDLSEATINNIMLSDTIIFWTVDDSAESFYEIIKSIRNLMFFESFFTNVALRGVITIGELEFVNYDITHPSLTINQSTLYGKAIVEAYHIEKEQEWIGCLVTDKAINRFLKKVPTPDAKDKVFNNFIIQYDVPKKGNQYQNSYVINWPQSYPIKMAKESIWNCFTKHHHISELADSVYLKYQNTLKFIEYVKSTRTDDT